MSLAPLGLEQAGGTDHLGLRGEAPLTLGWILAPRWGENRIAIRALPPLR
jgi:hypothetical protein